MATVTAWFAPHGGIPIYQAYGTAEWSWDVGAQINSSPNIAGIYWGFAVRPQSANAHVEVTRQWTTADKNGKQVEHFHVTVSPPPVGPDFWQAPANYTGAHNAALQFTVIKVDAI